MLSRVAETGHEIAASLPKEQCVLKLASRDRRTGANTPLCLPKIISRSNRSQLIRRSPLQWEPEAHRGIVMFAMWKREHRADRIKSGWPPPFSGVVGACAGLYRLARVGM
jgi:hypothetical protein